MPNIDETNKRIINRIQSDFPITSRPYLEIANELGLEETEVIERIRKLKKDGIIRRIGGNFGPEKLGFFSTLCAAKVPEDRIKAFTKVVNSYPGVTHNYLRENSYNIWFTFISQSVEEIADNLKEIEIITGVKGILNLPATNVYKIKAQFSL